MDENIGKITGFFKQKNWNSSSELTEAELLSPERSKWRIDSQDSVQSEDLTDSGSEHGRRSRGKIRQNPHKTD